MTLALSAVAGAIGAPCFDDACVTGYSVDTRTLAPGDLFFALRGPNHDGNAYAREALAKGAAAVVVDREVDAGRRGLVVRDPLRALQNLAAWARARWGGTLVAVTGSAGKTSTKDAIAHLLSAVFPVSRSAGNLNNHIGLPLSLLRLPETPQVAVMEMGMNHAGEIRELAGIARPDIGVVTNVGWAHAEFFESIDGVARAKRELIESLPAGGTAVLNADDARVAGFAEVHAGPTVTFGFSEGAQVRGEALETGPEGVKFRACGVEFTSRVAGRHGAMNLLAGIAAASVFGVPAPPLRDAAASLEPGTMRGRHTLREGVQIFDDCYNSNPEAARAMLDVLMATPARRRVAVLGEMLELGRWAEPLHRGVGSYAAERGIDVLIGIRGAARPMVDEAMKAGLPGGAAYFFDDPAQAGEFAGGLVQSGDAVLFKGSRGVKVELALKRFLEKITPAERGMR